jgi:hypothetical protein
MFFVDVAGIYDIHGGKFDAVVRWTGQMCVA